MDKRSLQHQLATLLGVDTDDDESYVADILESLLTIGDSPDDVADYLSSFVGNENEDVRQLSLDIQKFKAGGTLSKSGVKDGMQNVKISQDVTTSDSGDTKRKVLDEAAAHRQAIKNNAREKHQIEKKITSLKKKEVEDEQRRLWEEAVAAQKKNRSKSTITGGMRHEQSSTFTTTSSDLAQTTSSKVLSSQTAKDVGNMNEVQIEQKKIRQLHIKPRKGIPKNKPCGCFGNMHTPLKNCLSCGRISCELEGINDYCHFCGHLIGEDNYCYHDHDDAKLETAMRHKENLLEFDRTAASRTQILDDQEDYFVAATSMWNNEQEQGAVSYTHLTLPTKA